MKDLQKKLLSQAHSGDGLVCNAYAITRVGIRRRLCSGKKVLRYRAEDVQVIEDTADDAVEDRLM